MSGLIFFGPISETFHEGNVKKLSKEFYVSKLYKLAILHLNTGHLAIWDAKIPLSIASHLRSFHTAGDWGTGVLCWEGMARVYVETAQFQGFFVVPPLLKALLHQRICFLLFSRWFRHASGITIDLAKGSPMRIIECKVNASDGAWSAWNIYIRPSKFTWAKRKCLEDPFVSSPDC